MKTSDRSQFLSQAAVLALMLLALCASSFGQDSLNQYMQTDLVSNTSAMSPPVPDTNLVNAWGLSRSSGSPWWVSDNGTGFSTLYSVNAAGTSASIVPKVVTIPSGNPSVNAIGTPTGTIYNGGSLDFLLGPSAPAFFLFATLDGTISGWNPNYPSAGSTTATIKVNQSGKSSFTGLAVAQVDKHGTSATYLYVADFYQGRVEVFDTSFNPVQMSWESFRDDDDWRWEGYAPFSIWNIGGNLYVGYAKQSSSKLYQVFGPGLGFVDVFSPSGRLLQRLEHGDWFNAPWGLALAPSDFGLFSHDVLVGQFGSGEILAFDPVTGRFKGNLLDTSNNPITIDGLWAISFGNNSSAGPATALFFTAGPNAGSNGLFGNIMAKQNIEGNDQ